MLRITTATTSKPVDQDELRATAYQRLLNRIALSGHSGKSKSESRPSRARAHPNVANLTSTLNEREIENDDSRLASFGGIGN